MRVEPFERGRFKVYHNGDEFLVDLMPDRGNGSCDCWNFKKYIKARIEDAKALREFKPGRRFRCPHIDACLYFLAEMIVQDLMKKFPDWKDTEI